MDLHVLFFYCSEAACLPQTYSLCWVSIFCWQTLYRFHFFRLSSDAVHLVTYYCLPYLSLVEISRWPKNISLSMKMCSLVSEKKAVILLNLFNFHVLCKWEAWIRDELLINLVILLHRNLLNWTPVYVKGIVESKCNESLYWVNVHWSLYWVKVHWINVLSQSSLNHLNDYITSLGSIEDLQ